MSGMYFEDFEVGAVLIHEPSHTVTESDNSLFCAITMNPQPLHTDVEFARKSEYGQILVNGMFTLSLMMGLTVHDTTLGTTAGNLGFEGITFGGPVFLGDTITAESLVIGKRRSASRPSFGIVQFEHRARNQRGAVVVTCQRSALMMARGVSI